jgi:hypothetical protein
MTTTAITLPATESLTMQGSVFWYVGITAKGQRVFESPHAGLFYEVECDVGNGMMPLPADSAWARHAVIPEAEVEKYESASVEQKYVAGLDPARAVQAEVATAGTEQKPTNPKAMAGMKKPPILSVVPQTVLMEVAIGLAEGAFKYERHNYRVSGIRASTYIDTFRHMASWWEGEDLDPETGLSHITKMICSLIVLRDAQIQNNFVDDRPPQRNPEWMKHCQKLWDALCEKYPEESRREPWTQERYDAETA